MRQALVERKTQRLCRSPPSTENRSIHLLISRESINESYCEQAFRLIDRCILPPSRGYPSDFTGTGSAPVEEHSLFTAAGQHGHSTHFPLIAQQNAYKVILIRRHSQRYVFGFQHKFKHSISILDILVKTPISDCCIWIVRKSLVLYLNSFLTWIQCMLGISFMIYLAQEYGCTDGAHTLIECQ